MLAVEELLQPINSAAEAGRSLRYDPIFDSIREALSEDDETLPMGNWVRQVKRADYPLVISMAQDALRKRSKDLWLAGWLGEAAIQVGGSHALEPALRLIAGLQQRFWPSLYPEIEDDDLSMRAAPVQWSLDRFAVLLERFPIAKEGVPYSAYRAVRAGMAWSEHENSITAESLDEALQATPVEFYVGLDVELTEALSTLGGLQRFCSEHYGDGGPSFAVLRGVLEEMHGLVAQQLRLRAGPKADHSAPIAAESKEKETSPYPEATRENEDIFEVSESTREEPALVLTSTGQAGETFHRLSSTPQSWEDALSRVEACATYLFEQRPEDPVCYLLAMALQQRHNPSDPPGFPLPDARLALKRALESENWSALLRQAMRAVFTTDNPRWLDPHRYAWQAAANLGATRLQGLIAALLGAQLAENPSWPSQSFDDDTPVANAETRRWLESELAPRTEAPPMESEPILLSPKPPEESNDLLAAAAELIKRGETEQALDLLMQAEAGAQNGREKFLLRVEMCRVCLTADRKGMAANILRQMLSETEKLCLEEWEGRSLSGRLLSMLLTAIDHDNTNAEERRNIYARLCAIDPAQAFRLSAAV